jgi:uncharacterized protein (DUF433 family)
MAVSLLEREMYTVEEAARLLRMSPSTLMWWLEGGERPNRRTYRPVIRQEPTGLRTVTWAEFVEAGLLRQYRNQKVPLGELRAFIDHLRESVGVPYPLADKRPFVGEGQQLLLEAQRKAGLKGEFALVAEVSGQLLLTPPSEAYYTRVDWDEDLAVQWRPHDDPASPVRVSPKVRYGAPAVGGISTVVIWEHLEGDETMEEVADQFDLTPVEVGWAYSYEVSARATGANVDAA